MSEIDITRFKNKKTSIVLSGGVVKAAAWHLGVAMALEEMGFTLKHNDSKTSDFEISSYVGSSAGSLISLFFASGFRPIDVVEAFIDTSNASIPPITYKDMLSLKKLPGVYKKNIDYDPLNGIPILFKSALKLFIGKPGFFSTYGLQQYILKNIIHSNDFADYKADLFIVATQLDHSRKVIFSKYKYPNPIHDPTVTYYIDTPIADSVAASMSVPPFYSPYPIANSYTDQLEYYIDGEIRETLSTHVASDNKCDYAISSWTHTPYHFNSEIGSLVNYGIPAIAIQSIYLMIQKKIITARAKTFRAKDAIETVNSYLKSNKFPEKHRKNIVSILEQKLNYNPKLTLIDIYPKHENSKLFFGNSFSLNPNLTAEFVKSGYQRTFEVFRDLPDD